MSMLRWLATELRGERVDSQAAVTEPATHPYPNRRRNNRALILYSAVVMATLVAAPTGIAVVVLMGAVAVRSSLFVARRLRAHPRSAAARASDNPGAAVVGQDTRTGRSVTIADRALAAHGLVLGASGSGKTTTLLTLATHQINKQRPVIVIDLKGSPGFASDLSAAAARAGRRTTVWTLDGGAVWNPLAHGNATELKDKLIATERFTEPHYKRAAERYLQTAIQVLQERSRSRAVTLAGVVELLDPRRLAASAADLPPARTAAVRDYVRSLTPDQLSAVRGLASRLALITESHTGPFLEPPVARQSLHSGGAPTQGGSTPQRLAGHAPPELDVRAALNGGDVVLFSLNSSSYGHLAAQIGTMVVQDLVTAAGARLNDGGNPPQATVVIDEFSALGSDNVLALLARGRESGVGVLLATQELSDLDRAGRGFRQQVVGNTAVKISHRQDVPESAEAVSRMAGSVKDWEHTFTERDGGRSYGTNARIVDRPLVEPAAIQRMQTGEAVVTTKSPRFETHMTRVKRTGVERGVER